MKASSRSQHPLQTEQQESKPDQEQHAIAQTSKKWRWLKVIEFAVLGFATWLNPEAGFLIFLLRLCFKILEVFQDKQTSK